MKLESVVTFAYAAALVACAAETPPPQSASSPTHLTSATARAPANATDVPPVVRPNPAPTASSAHGDTSELAISAGIRKSLMADTSLSFAAKNVTITTSGSKVTLRGEVASDREKRAIELYAKRQMGVLTVENLLDVAQ